MDSQHVRTVVIGAGPAGLATAAQLRRRGVQVLVVERAGAVGASWRGRYDRLRLNSSRPFSKLPGARYPAGTPMFPSRDQVVSYLEGYARDNELEIRFRTHVERLEPHAGGWSVQTSTGDLSADQVVVAAGYEHTFWVPRWPGRDRFEGRLIHSAEYRNAEEFRGVDVLVVGPGSSGMEIAYDLAEGGAGRVRLAIRTPPNIIIRDPLGVFIARRVVKLLPAARADRLMGAVRRRQLGDLAPFGLPQPEEGVVSRLKRLGVAPAIVDREVIEAVTDGRIEVVAAVESLDESGVLLADGARIEPDALIAATGYRRGLEGMVGHLGVLGEHGAPVRNVREVRPGLRFVGYVHEPGVIGLLGKEAKEVAREISASRRASSRPRRAARARPRAAQGA